MTFTFIFCFVITLKTRAGWSERSDAAPTQRPKHSVICNKTKKKLKKQSYEYEHEDKQQEASEVESFNWTKTLTKRIKRERNKTTQNGRHRGSLIHWAAKIINYELRKSSTWFFFSSFERDLPSASRRRPEHLSGEKIEDTRGDQKAQRWKFQNRTGKFLVQTPVRRT